MRMNIVTQANIVRDCGGTLVAPELPSKQQWDAALNKEAGIEAALKRNGGCGVELYTFGRGSPFIRCGSSVTSFGKTKIAKCPACAG